MRVYKNIFNKIISLENLFLAWDKFKSDKQTKWDVQQFEWRLEENIFKLHRDLKYKRYKHGKYTSFHIQDPKQRHIHKATVQDRVLHHAVFSVVSPIFEPSFIPNSLSCRIGKGTHKGIDILEKMLLKTSGNALKHCFALKCDIKKFFETVDHRILLSIISRKIKDADALWLLQEIIESFASQYSTLFERKGLPIGNLTSQLFANIYLNEFDQFLKHKLKVKEYLRYTDDFIIVAQDKLYLENITAPIRSFLVKKLALQLHPKKITIRKFHQGIDFLGYVLLPHYRLLRNKTKRRIFRKLKMRVREYKNRVLSKQTLNQSVQSYLGVLSRANTYKLGQELKNHFWFWLSE